MEFLDLTEAGGIAASNLALCLHKPSSAAARRRFAALLEHAPEVVEAYQSTHSTIAEGTLKRRRFMASFLAGAPGELTFIGLYEVAGWEDLSAQALDAMPAMARMKAAMEDRSFAEEGRGRALFDLRPDGRLIDLRGRAVVADPGSRAYMRRAETTPLPILELRRTPRLAPPMPPWTEFALAAPEIADLPRDWAAALAEWRGIYLITDESDGARYVGSAYGAENLLGRWRAHVAREAGVTVGLADRDPASFRFSILDRLSPDAPAEEVIRVEQTWMERLHTVRFGLNRPGADNRPSIA